MKNLNKKISAVALASMVVLGGVAASGANSFAAQSDKEKINNVLNDLGYCYQVIDEFSDINEAKNAINSGKYSDISRANSSIVRVNDKDINRKLGRLLSSRYRRKICLVEFNNKAYSIGLSYEFLKE